MCRYIAFDQKENGSAIVLEAIEVQIAPDSGTLFIESINGTEPSHLVGKKAIVIGPITDGRCDEIMENLVENDPDTWPHEISSELCVERKSKRVKAIA